MVQRIETKNNPGDLNAELLAKLNSAMGAFSEFKEAQTAHNKKYDGLNVEKLNKTAEEVGGIIELSQQLKQAVHALEQKNQALEAALARPVIGKSAKDTDAETKKLHTKLFNKFVREGNYAGDFESYFMAETAGEKSEFKDLRVGTDADGGFLVTPQISELIKTRFFETSPLRMLANTITIGTDSYEVLTDYDQATSGGWVSEVGTRATTNTPQIGKIIIPTHEQFAQPQATQKFLDDARIDAESWIADKIADIITRTENTAFVTGTGAGKPKGIMAYSAWAVNGTYENDKVEQINSGTSGAFTYEGLVDLQNSLKEVYQANAQFLYKRATNAAIMKIVDGESRPIFNMTYDKNAGLQPTLLGRPVNFADDVAAIGAAALAAAYGDFKQGYQIVDRAGIRILRDPYTNKPYVKFYATKRVGGAVVNFEAFKIQKLS